MIFFLEYPKIYAKIIVCLENTTSKFLSGSPIEISIDGFLNSASMELSYILRGFCQIFEFCIAFFKIDGFPGTRGTRSKGAPACPKLT